MMSYINKFDERTEATKRAQAILQARGVYFPLPDSNLSLEENYERILRYSEKEAALVVELLKTPVITEQPKAPIKETWVPWRDN